MPEKDASKGSTLCQNWMKMLAKIVKIVVKNISETFSIRKKHERKTTKNLNVFLKTQNE